MRQILSSGVTGILVSHSIGQVKELCNKVLWLDHGNQIVFSDEVELYCNTYEEFQETKHLPDDRDDAVRMAENYLLRQQNEQAEKAKKQLKKLEVNLSDSATAELVSEAERIIRKYQPELLAEKKKDEGFSEDFNQDRNE